MPAQATKKETTCPSTGLMRRRWVALTHWGAAGRQAMSKLPAQTGCQAAVLGFQPPPSHQATPRLYTSTTPLGVPMTPGFPLCPCGRCDFANARGIYMVSALISQVQLWSTAQRDWRFFWSRLRYRQCLVVCLMSFVESLRNAKNPACLLPEDRMTMILHNHNQLVHPTSNHVTKMETSFGQKNYLSFFAKHQKQTFFKVHQTEHFNQPIEQKNKKQ